MERRLRVAIRSRNGFEKWCRVALEPFGEEPAPHHLFLIRALEQVADGDCDRLMLFMPPGSAKSTYVSQLFPPYMMARFPRLNVTGVSHTSDLAEIFSGKVQDFIRDNAIRLGYSLVTEAKKSWKVSNRADYRAVGVGGALTGRRSDLMVIDDPVKGRAEADSQAYREAIWQWYRSVAVTRLKPGARIVVVMTRWHPDDLAGRLLEQEALGADKWRVINLPALAEADDQMGRAPGQALWPMWEDEAALERKRLSVGAREWASLYQQQPRVTEGSLFKVDKITAIPPAPQIVYTAAPPQYLSSGIPNPAYYTRKEQAQLPVIVRAWDIAATDQVGGNDPDWTVGLKLARTPEGRFAVLDVVRFRGSPHEVERRMVETAALDGQEVQIDMPQDPGAAGKAQVVYYTTKLAGYRVVSSPETGDKSTRAGPVASQVEAGNVDIVRGAWNLAFIDELRDFPAGRKDDQVDALSRAFNALTITPDPGPRHTRTRYMSR